jgi:multiple sugar transport system permease protein
MKKKSGRRKRIIGRETKYLLLYAGPAIIYMIVLTLYPIAYNFFLMFRNMDTQHFLNHEFVGLETIKTVLSEGIVGMAAYNTVFFTVMCTAIQFTVGFLFALLYHRKIKGAGFFKGLVLIGWLIPMTVTGLLFKFMFQTDTGVVNYLLMQSGLIDRPVQWLSQGGSALWTIILANCWVGIPFDMVLLSTGLSSIPENVMESASIDGANRMQRFFYITLPMLKPVMCSILVLGVIYTFKVFDLVVVITGGGPVNATQMLSTYSYQLAFREFNFSEASVVANLMFALLFFIGLAYLKFVRSDEVMS